MGRSPAFQADSPTRWSMALDPHTYISGRVNSMGDNDDVTDTPPDRVPPEDGRGRWLSFEPLAGTTTDGDDDPVIRVVRLRCHEHAGPFWDDQGHISDDYDDLRRMIGISRTLFDDVMAWNARFAASAAVRPGAERNARHLATQRQLTHRLRREVPPSIDVPDPT